MDSWLAICLRPFFLRIFFYRFYRALYRYHGSHLNDQTSFHPILRKMQDNGRGAEEKRQLSSLPPKNIKRENKSER